MTYVRTTSNVLKKRHTHFYRGGGYITYFKMYIMLIKWVIFAFDSLGEMEKQVTASLNQNYKSRQFFSKVWFWVGFIIKTPYWLFIKPLGCLFTIKRTFDVTFYLENDKLVKYEMNKNTIYSLWFLKFIPIFGFIKPYLSEKEINYLLN